MKSDPASNASRRLRRRVIILLLIAIAAAGIAIGVKETRHYLLPKRFAEVEPGRLYRSGLMEAYPMQKVLDEHGIKTIVTLLGEDSQDPRQAEEARLAAERGIEVIRLPMPGDGRGQFELLEKAADVMADPSHGPTLVHCAAGVQRTGAAYAVYRMKYDGWTPDEALAEGDRLGCSIRDEPELTAHLRQFYQDRIATTRPAESRPSSP